MAEAIRLIKRELPAGTPLIGFAGAPVTLAAYLVEGGGSQDFRRFKRMLYGRPDLVETLLDVLADQVGEHLAMQAEAGADAVQLFDTWAESCTRRTTGASRCRVSAASSSAWAAPASRASSLPVAAPRCCRWRQRPAQRRSVWTGRLAWRTPCVW